MSATAAALTAWHRWRARQTKRTEQQSATALVAALGLFVAELRAGAHPATAAAVTADAADPSVGPVFTRVAAAARLGGDVATVLRYRPGRSDNRGLESHGGASYHRGDSAEAVAASGALDRVAEAWTLAGRHGIPLADLVEAVRADTEARLRFGNETDARLAGPRATAAVLTALPVLGLALGQAIGAGPWHVLTGSALGQLLLVVGTGLSCAGVLWSARLVAKAGTT